MHQTNTLFLDNMRHKFFVSLILALSMTAVVNAQSSVVVVDPRVGVSASDAGRQATDKVVIERDAIPKVRE